MGLQRIPVAKLEHQTILREDDCWKIKKKSIYTPRGRKKEDETKSAVRAIKSVMLYIKMFFFFLSCLTYFLCRLTWFQHEPLVVRWGLIVQQSKAELQSGGVSRGAAAATARRVLGAYYSSGVKLCGQDKGENKNHRQKASVCEHRGLNICEVSFVSTGMDYIPSFL